LSSSQSTNTGLSVAETTSSHATDDLYGHPGSVPPGTGI
jgi:hypothetical protein